MSRWGGAFVRRWKVTAISKRTPGLPFTRGTGRAQGQGEASVAVARTVAGDSQDVADRRPPPASGRPGTCEDDARCTRQPIPCIFRRKTVRCSGINGSQASVLLEREDQAFGHGDAAVLTESTESRLDPFPVAPRLVLVAIE